MSNSETVYTLSNVANILDNFLTDEVRKSLDEDDWNDLVTAWTSIDMIASRLEEEGEEEREQPRWTPEEFLGTF